MDSCLLLMDVGEKLLNSMLGLPPSFLFIIITVCVVYMCVHVYVGVLVLCEHVEARGQYWCFLIALHLW